MKTVAYVTANLLHLRQAPSTSAPVIAELSQGQTVTVLQQEGAWSSVQSEALTGYVDSTYIRSTLLFADASHWQGSPRWSALVEDGSFVGAILKATEGTGSVGWSWFCEQWPLLRAAGAERYGESWFRGSYHYLAFLEDGAQQADAYLSALSAAGGTAQADLRPIVDVELGPPGSDNRKASAQQVIDCTSAWSAKILSETGTAPILYGREAMHELHITDRMGCAYLWNPSYTTEMIAADDIGWPSELVMLWQYTDGKVPATATPRIVPGIGPGDISRFLGGGLTDLKGKLVAAPLPSP